jgi:hypothetical protein
MINTNPHLRAFNPLTTESVNPAKLSELAEAERRRAKIHVPHMRDPANAGPESVNPAKLSELAETERRRAFA